MTCKSWSVLSRTVVQWTFTLLSYVSFLNEQILPFLYSVQVYGFWGSGSYVRLNEMEKRRRFQTIYRQFLLMNTISMSHEEKVTTVQGFRKVICVSWRAVHADELKAVLFHFWLNYLFQFHCCVLLRYRKSGTVYDGISTQKNWRELKWSNEYINRVWGNSHYHGEFKYSIICLSFTWNRKTSGELGSFLNPNPIFLSRWTSGTSLHFTGSRIRLWQHIIKEHLI